MTSSLSVLLSFAVFLFLVARPIKKAGTKLLDDKISSAQRDMNEACNIRLEAELVLKQAQQDFETITAKRDRIKLLAEQHIEALGASYKKKSEELQERRTAVLTQSTEHAKQQMVLKLKSELLTRCIEAISGDLKELDAAVDKEALLRSNNILLKSAISVTESLRAN